MSEDETAGQGGAAEHEAPQLVYGNCAEFFDGFLRHVYARQINGAGTHWSARWWESAEAVYRIDALWRAWEHLRLDAATGSSTWLRDHADYHLGILMSPAGPFGKDTDRHPFGPLPHEAPRDGLFIDERTEA